MVEYPIKFEAEARAESSEEDWEIDTSEALETRMSTPEEFGGDSKNPSPEDLFNASLTSCVLATFKITAERKNLKYSEIEMECRTELDRNDQGRPVMKNSKISVEVNGVSDIELAEEVGEITERNCFIHNSVKTDIKTKFNFSGN